MTDTTMAEFIRALPPDCPLPEVEVYDGVDVCLAWYGDNAWAEAFFAPGLPRVEYVLFDPHHHTDAFWAGEVRKRLVVDFDGSIPPDVVAALKRIAPAPPVDLVEEPRA